MCDLPQTLAGAQLQPTAPSPLSGSLIPGFERQTQACERSVKEQRASAGCWRAVSHLELFLGQILLPTSGFYKVGT